MTVPTYEEARAVIYAEREAKIAKAFAAAWHDWETCPVRGKYSCWPRTRANMVFERIADYLLEEFADDPGVRLVFMDETIKVVFDEKIVARCKKANALGLGQNIETQIVLKFVEAQPDIPGLDGLKKLEIVYVLNELQTTIRDVVVQARDGDLRLYSYAIGDAAEGAAVLPFPALPPHRPAPQPGGSIYDASDLVQPRKPNERGENVELE